MEDVNACPFCGSSNTGITTCDNIMHHVICYDCGSSSGTCDNKDQALAKWNTRCGGWKSMPAPNNVDILLTRVDGSIELVLAGDNDYDWQTTTEYARSPTWFTAPIKWMIVI